jgi:LysM repeat protein
VWYKVQPGVSLKVRAQSNGVTVDELIEINCLDQDEPLAGQFLSLIPEQ